MNILITQDKNIILLFKIYYFILFLIVFTVLTSLIFTNSFYQKSDLTKNISINAEKEDLTISYINDFHTAKSLQQNKFFDDFNKH